MTTSKTLDSLIILNTRPASQNHKLNQLIKERGGKAVSLPTLLIHFIDLSFPISFNLYDTVIFTSANAVVGAKKMRIQNFSSPAVAIGPGTAEAMKVVNLPVAALPTQFNSEGLLDLPLLKNAHHKKILIFCGKNPRPLLRDELTNRGAEVTLAPVYERLCPPFNIKEALPALKQKNIDVIISTSAESLQNLYHMLTPEGLPWLKKIPLLVTSKKMEALTKNLTLKQPPIIATGSDDEAVIQALLKWYTTKKK